MSKKEENLTDKIYKDLWNRVVFWESESDVSYSEILGVLDLMRFDLLMHREIEFEIGEEDD